MKAEKQRCKATVPGSGSWHRYSCSRAATKDGYCQQHHPTRVAERRAASNEQHKKRMAHTTWTWDCKKLASLIVEEVLAAVAIEGHPDESHAMRRIIILGRELATLRGKEPPK